MKDTFDIQGWMRKNLLTENSRGNRHRVRFLTEANTMDDSREDIKNRQIRAKGGNWGGSVGKFVENYGEELAQIGNNPSATRQDLVNFIQSVIDTGELNDEAVKYMNRIFGEEKTKNGILFRVYDAMQKGVGNAIGKHSNLKEGEELDERKDSNPNDAVELGPDGIYRPARYFHDNLDERKGKDGFVDPEMLEEDDEEPDFASLAKPVDTGLPKGEPKEKESKAEKKGGVDVADLGWTLCMGTFINPTATVEERNAAVEKALGTVNNLLAKANEKPITFRELRGIVSKEYNKYREENDIATTTRLGDAILKAFKLTPNAVHNMVFNLMTKIAGTTESGEQKKPSPGDVAEAIYRTSRALNNMAKQKGIKIPTKTGELVAMDIVPILRNHGQGLFTNLSIMPSPGGDRVQVTGAIPWNRKVMGGKGMTNNPTDTYTGQSVDAPKKRGIQFSNLGMVDRKNINKLFPGKEGDEIKTAFYNSTVNTQKRFLTALRAKAGKAELRDILNSGDSVDEVLGEDYRQDLRALGKQQDMDDINAELGIDDEPDQFYGSSAMNVSELPDDYSDYDEEAIRKSYTSLHNKGVSDDQAMKILAKAYDAPEATIRDMFRDMFANFKEKPIDVDEPKDRMSNFRLPKPKSREELAAARAAAKAAMADDEDFNPDDPDAEADADERRARAKAAFAAERDPDEEAAEAGEEETPKKGTPITPETVKPNEFYLEGCRTPFIIQPEYHFEETKEEFWNRINSYKRPAAGLEAVRRVFEGALRDIKKGRANSPQYIYIVSDGHYLVHDRKYREGDTVERFRNKFNDEKKHETGDVAVKKCVGSVTGESAAGTTNVTATENTYGGLELSDSEVRGFVHSPRWNEMSIAEKLKSEYFPWSDEASDYMDPEEIKDAKEAIKN